MSGIAGVLHFDGAPVEPSLLQRMTDAIGHCGPDRAGVRVGGGTGLGHRLLRTTPESAGEAQPSSLDGRVWITADARVDGRHELIRLLDGVRRDVTEDAPDDELILHAYHAWGEGCVEHLIGDFAFAIWDEGRQRLFCARDQFGVIPFHYARLPNGLAFGNALRGVLAHPAVSDQLNEQAVGDYLLFRMNTDLTTTFFADVRSLPPAHTLTWEDGQLRERRYWHAPVLEVGPRLRPAEYVDRFRAVFDQAVGDRLRSQAVAAHLSGGMDASSITATAHKLLTARGSSFDLRAYTIVFDHLFEEEEGPLAQQVATALGISLEHLTAEEYLQRAPHAVPPWAFPEPTGIPTQLSEYEITRRASTFARSLLVGFGGDPLFATGAAARPIGARARATSAADHLRQSLLVDRRRPRLGLRRRLRGARQPPAHALPSWIDPDFARRTDLAQRQAQVVHDSRSAADPMLSPYWVNLFAWGHPGTHGLPLKMLFPFFDVRLVTVVRQTPPHFWRDKGLLREAMRGLLPEAVRVRPKTPLYVPSRNGNADPMYPLAAEAATQRWQRELVMTPDLRRYVDIERALAVIESPSATMSDDAIDPCLEVGYWLRSEGRRG